MLMIPTYLCLIKMVKKLNTEANLCLQELETWFKTNKLTLNLDKHVMVSFSIRATDCISLTFDGIDIHKVHTYFCNCVIK